MEVQWNKYHLQKVSKCPKLMKIYQKINTLIHLLGVLRIELFDGWIKFKGNHFFVSLFIY